MVQAVIQCLRDEPNLCGKKAEFVAFPILEVGQVPRKISIMFTAPLMKNREEDLSMHVLQREEEGGEQQILPQFNWKGQGAPYRSGRESIRLQLEEITPLQTAQINGVNALQSHTIGRVVLKSSPTLVHPQ